MLLLNLLYILLLLFLLLLLLLLLYLPLNRIAIDYRSPLGIGEVL
jgi:hypothetical protein